jgi:very-short-patch-repair endonuclease
MRSSMHFGAKPIAFKKAQALRDTETVEEKMIWDIVKDNQILGFRFRRQHPMADFIADFYCHRANLVIEIDGDVHKSQQDYDAARTEIMKTFGVSVIRFRNEEVRGNINSVKEKIKAELSLVPKRKLGRGL